MKNVSLVEPYQYDFLPFQRPIFDIAEELGFRTENNYGRFPRIFHYFIYHWPVNFHLPFIQSKNVKLQFVSATHPGPMIFPYAFRNELIPVIWDCWPRCREQIQRLMNTCDINIAFFTQRANVDFFSKLYPNKKIYFLPEAINTSLYHTGCELCKRDIDVIEYGRSNGVIHDEIRKLSGIKHIFPKHKQQLFNCFDDLAMAISNSKIAIAYPRSLTEKELSGGLETLTQRYWECMYSGTLIIGHAPNELVDLVGYNPVIEANPTEISKIINKVLSQLSSYQELANKNVKSATIYGSWEKRLIYLRDILKLNGYLI